MSLWKAAVLTFALLLAPCLPAQGANERLSRANALLQAGETDKALTLLAETLNASLSTADQAQAYNLRCRVQITLEHWDKAVSACEQAVALAGGDSNYQMWLGRALGGKAGRASMLSAFSLAKRVRAAFEQAVRLDPRNAAALADLTDFYTSAPGIVGGGAAKAEKTIAQLEPLDPGRAHELRGQLATHQKRDPAIAEREFKQAVASSSYPAPRWMMLAAFYRQQQRWSEMTSALQSCAASAAKDRRPAVAVYDAASVLIEADREPQQAIKYIETYLAGPRSEEAPAAQAHVRLARLRAKLGDKAGARREQEAALALAHDYSPALALNQAE